ncbi:hypothetical protein CCH79_00007653 [Gambusia affinis]|uniref:Uncharacterized protein n=1 Tax=Gambusia affinis TaxID=33528 RepID=A0A315WBK3_GAMAF|nr:hypothetical protein CCH79_00007653 [Gambusia affinis]
MVSEGKARVPEGDVGVPAPKSLNDVPERQQGAVDVLGLLQPLPFGSRLPDPLGAGQVHQSTSSCVACGWKTLSNSKLRPFPLFNTVREDSLLGSVVTTTDCPSSCWSSFSTGLTRHSTRMLPETERRLRDSSSSSLTLSSRFLSSSPLLHSLCSPFLSSCESCSARCCRDVSSC